jgi:hypothetical protein
MLPPRPAQRQAQSRQRDQAGEHPADISAVRHCRHPCTHDAQIIGRGIYLMSVISALSTEKSSSKVFYEQMNYRKRPSRAGFSATLA